MKRFIALTLCLVVIVPFLIGCDSNLKVGIDIESEYDLIPRSEDFVYYGPTKVFPMGDGIEARIIKTDAITEIENPYKDSPYPTLHSPEGRFLILEIEAQRTGGVLAENAELVILNVLGWDYQIADDDKLIETLESSIGLEHFSFDKVTKEKKRFFLCYLISGFSEGWMLHIFEGQGTDKRLKSIVDTGI
ncbi:MAG TPA: hypothetical protein PKV16_02045 [Caldisericia bacterium]|nr:hypothetical protein [Caldisericia bacterium]HPF48094.1 hypothetical protein [Caldisericia bacterium]HPI83969.1 hypothetical protein [Caldisericia bacterium]HPQ92547.1 hypothetical protein [Caldisericia bacterium]HRV74355.1 hypothetical protein [Caldisericia bacterium]